MGVNNYIHPKLEPTKRIVKPAQITLIEGDHFLMQSLYEALRSYGYQPRLFHQPDDALVYLSKTDILLVDISVAQHPKSSKYIKVPIMLVLGASDSDQLPPWLQTRHVFLLRYPQNAQEFIERLTDYLSPRTLDFGIDPDNNEHLALLFGITQFLSGHLDINDLFERVLALTPYLEAEFAALLIQEEEEIIYYRSTQPGREELVGPTGRRFAQRLLKDGLEGWVLRHSEAVVLPNTRNDSRWFRASYLPDQEHCVVAIPISLERIEARGVYLLGHNQPGHFNKEDLPLLKAATTQIGMAIENGLLFKNQSQRSVQLALINQVSQAATSILNLDVMLRTIVQAIRSSFACYSVAIHLYNQDTNTVELRAKATLGPRGAILLEQHNEQVTTHKLRQGLIGWSIATNKTILTNDVTRDPRYVSTPGNREVRAELCVPITLGVKAIGVLDLQSVQLEAFDKYHVAALETLADQLAIAIENARLYDEINQRVQTLKSLNEIGQAITSTLDLRKTLTLITDHTTRLMEVAAASVVLRDDDNGEVWFAAASGEGSKSVIGLRMALGQGIAGWVAAEGEPVIVPDVYTDQRFFANVDTQSGFTTRSILCVPLQTKGRTIGALEVMNKKAGVFNKEDLAMLQALAIPAATAIENAQLYEEQTTTIKSLAETQNQLIQSAKLAAVGELAAGVAHEINNPLTTIIGLASLLLDSLDFTSANRESFEDLHLINQEARRARDIVRSLLDFARADTPKPRPTDFNQLIEEAIFLVYTKSVSQKISLRREFSDLPEIFLDSNQIKQVMVNLLNNAVQVMLESESHPAILTVVTSLSSRPAPANGENRRTSETQPVVICKISDTGKGIKPEHLNKIFDPFFTTKEVGKGTGLGLSISYGIVEKHGGAISVESIFGQGSTFTVTLPVTIPPPEATEPVGQSGAALLPRI
jgi:signal transduction histidine kinase